MTWYKYALRKHYLRFDPRVMIALEANDPNLDAYGSAFTSGAIIKGLDILGLCSHDVNIPIRIKTRFNLMNNGLNARIKLMI